MKKATKKLVLSKETLRALNDADLRQVAGGRPPPTDRTGCSDFSCYSEGPGCTTGEYYGCFRDR
jgi:hypothetical protein